MSLAIFTFAFSAICFAVLTAFLCWRDSAASAGIAATTAVLSVLLAYFPSLSSLDALTIHVKMRENFQESENIVEALKKLAIKSAASTVFSIGDTVPQQPSRAITAFPLSDVQFAIINATLGEVRGLNLTEQQKHEVTEPLMGFIDGQLANAYNNQTENKIRVLKIEKRDIETKVKDIEDAVPDFENMLPIKRREALQIFMDHVKQVGISSGVDTDTEEQILQKKVLDAHDDLADGLIYSKALQDLLKNNYEAGFPQLQQK